MYLQQGLKIFSFRRKIPSLLVAPLHFHSVTLSSIVEWMSISLFQSLESGAVALVCWISGETPHNVGIFITHNRGALKEEDFVLFFVQR